MSIEANKDVSDSTQANKGRSPAGDRLTQEVYGEPTKQSSFQTKPDGTLVREFASGGNFQVRPDGTVIEQFTNGETFTYQRNGSTVRCLTDGSTTVEYADGSRLALTPEGGQIQELPTGIKIGIGPDGSRVLEFPDGSRSTLKPDGTRTTVFAGNQQLLEMEGYVETILPDDTKICEFEDGLKIESRPDGTEIVTEPDGRRITARPGGGGRSVEYPDGRIKHGYTGQDELLDTLFPGTSRQVPGTVAAGPVNALDEAQLARALDNLPPEPTNVPRATGIQPAAPQLQEGLAAPASALDEAQLARVLDNLPPESTTMPGTTGTRAATPPLQPNLAASNGAELSGYRVEAPGAVGVEPPGRWDLSRLLQTPRGQIVSGALGAVGVIGGGLQIRHGLHLMAQGNTGEGMFTVVGGAANTTSGAACFAPRVPWAGNLALRAGGAGAIIDGALTLNRGLQSGDTALQVDGGVRLTAGGAMLVGGPAGAVGASAYAGWASGRFLGENVSWHGKTLDQHTTQMADKLLNGQVNQQLQGIEANNRVLLDKQKSIIGQSYEDMKASGKTARDVSEAILGLREEMEASGKEGCTVDCGKMQEEVTRLIKIRAQLAADQASS